MPAKRRLTMRQLRQMLRLAGSGTSSREIAVVLGVARSTVQDNLKRAAQVGLTWPLPGELTDDALEHRLFARAGVKQGQRRRKEPDWAELSIELKKPGVTLLILWEEYRSVHPDGYGYSRFCELFRGFEQRLSPTMRQEHAAGDKVFVDYSGKKVPIVDRKTGEVREAELFVGVLGASSYTFNDHVMRRLGVSRRHLFETVERPALANLPAEDYEFAEWRLARVSTDYHVEFNSFFYSVPHGLIRSQVDIRATARMIEIFHRGKRVAVHQRRYGGRALAPTPIICRARIADTPS